MPEIAHSTPQALTYFRIELFSKNSTIELTSTFRKEDKISLEISKILEKFELKPALKLIFGNDC